MSAGDLMNSGFNPDAARYDRLNRTQPAPFAPGQDAVFQQTDAFAQSAVPNDPGAMNDVFSHGIGGAASGGLGADTMNPFGPGGGLNPMQPGVSPNSMQPGMMQQAQQQDPADKFWAAAGKFFSGSRDFMKELMSAKSQLTIRWYCDWGFKNGCIGVGIIVGGIILKVFGFPLGGTVASGGALTACIGGFTWLFTSEKARTVTSKYKDMPQSQPEPQLQSPPTPSGFDFPSDPGTDFFDPSSDSQDDDLWGDVDVDPDDDPYAGDDPYAELDTVEQAEPGMSAEEALASMPEITPGMYTRSYLWEMFTKVLPTMQPGYAKMKTYDDSDDTFLYWDSILREAAQVAGCKEDFLPDLEELQENMFVIVATCNRPQGFKPELVASELANIYAYADGTKNENVFAKVDTIGAHCKITIFNGAAAMISLKDMMLQQKDWICDTKNYMPVVLGIDQLGKVITVDCKKLESIIITGMPRSGKSWFVQAVLTQMCAFTPPSELNIFICDPKDDVSDFKDFKLPHVKKFVSGDNNIVKTLNNLVKVEGPRRKKIIGDAGFVNIWDYKEQNPDVKLPIIYVVIDEVVTLASRMDKETNNEFRMLLRELISQLPALGIRAFLIPHVLNNDIIEKKTSDLVPCKISVCGDADHIEKATGSKPKEFPYRLVNKGDMAVKLTGFYNTLYVHGPALTESNPKNKALFDYMRRSWGKLCPEETGDSVAKHEEVRQAVQAVPLEVGDLSGSAQDSDNPGSDEPQGLGYADIIGDGDDDDFKLF